MRAVVCEAFGPPESLRFKEIDDPVPGPGELLVDVRACAISFPDLLMIQDLYQFKPTPPFVPGGEVAGVVTALGEGVAGYLIGDEVFANGSLGGLAEKATIKASSAMRLPAGTDAEHVAGFAYAYGTSYHALADRARLEPGETLLVLGAAGGVGLAAVELGAVMGANVIAAASSDDKLALCREHGATMTINYATEDLRGQLKELTGGAGPDVIYDPVGGPYAEPALRSIAWEGRFLVVGFAAGDIPRVPLNLPLLKNCSIVGVFWGANVARNPDHARESLALLVEWLEQGKLHPAVGARFPLDDAVSALNELATRRAMGRVIVTPGSS
jgi:NADPH2:quinone reductase